VSDSRRSGTIWIALSIVFAAIVIGGALLWVNRTPAPAETKPAATAPAGEKPATSSTSTPKIIERSERAKNLQRELKRLGFYSGAIDGVYGPATTDAVKKLQAKLGVEATGIFNPATAEAGVAQGYFKKSDTVMSMQVALTTLGYYDGEINGLYDEATEKAVKAFQEDHNMKADGFFSPELGSELEKALNGE
jgi:peptidoglycan hydrolase-like protein with peptidoglycan-binding domain